MKYFIVLMILSLPAQALELQPWEGPHSLYDSLNKEYSGIGNMGTYKVPAIRDRFITTHPNGGGLRLPQERGEKRYEFNSPKFPYASR